MDAGCIALVKANKILVSVLGRAKLARGRLLGQTPNSTNKCRLVRSRVVVPLVADGGVGTVTGVSGLEMVVEILYLVDDLSGVVLKIFIKVMMTVVSRLSLPRLQVGVVSGAKDREVAEVVSAQVLVASCFLEVDVVDFTKIRERPALLGAVVEAEAEIVTGLGLLRGN
jgi:hypothetical protein